MARRNREDGNAAFQSGNHELAVVLYTEAMRYSPVHPTTHEGEDFAAAAANRSAALMALGKFEECLEDVQLAIEAGYTAAAAYKLYIRQACCQIWTLSFSALPTLSIYSSTTWDHYFLSCTVIVCKL